jgi:hypothetical protein
MLMETSQTIREWGDATFGEARDLTALVARARAELLVARARAELDELEEAVGAGEMAEAGREAADVVILLHRLVALAGMDLGEQVDAKMTVNRARKWRAAGDGTGGHV